MNWHYAGPRFQFAAELALFSACVRSVVDDSLNCPFNCSLQDSWRVSVDALKCEKNFFFQNQLLKYVLEGYRAIAIDTGFFFCVYACTLLGFFS
uniref:Uncharacterized protein n=1 Tax=Rhipicephalus microplus TaxID=6941 RepID=A0A6M2DA40_RHIMP